MTSTLDSFFNATSFTTINPISAVTTTNGESTTVNNRILPFVVAAVFQITTPLLICHLKIINLLHFKYKNNANPS